MTSTHAQEIAEALEGAPGDALIALMNETLRRGADPTAAEATKSTARRLGWIDDAGHFTKTGFLAADPLREYVYWEKRGRTITYNEKTPFLGPALFTGKRVLELGCGFGVNLLTLQSQAAWLAGVELVPYYLNFTAPLAKRAGVAKPNIILADATEVPLDAGSCDVVMALGALQYMPFRKALAEVARLLAPGGLAVFVNSTLAGYLRNSLADVPKVLRSRPKSLGREALTIGNMLLYPWTERRLTRLGDPVYLPQRTMQRWLEEAGFRVDERTHQFEGNETCWVAERR